MIVSLSVFGVSRAIFLCDLEMSTSEEPQHQTLRQIAILFVQRTSTNPRVLYLLTLVFFGKTIGPLKNLFSIFGRSMVVICSDILN